MVEPNRLQGQATPNTIAATSDDRSIGTRDPARRSATRPGQPRTARGRGVVVAGLALAALGIPLFFLDTVTTAELGVGVICIGIGLALIGAVRRSPAARDAAARRSRSASVGAFLGAPYTVTAALIGLGLIAYGAFFVVTALKPA